MKRRSKLFLIVAGVLVALGAVLCVVGYCVSFGTGEQILADRFGSEKGYTEYFGSDDLDKIKLSVEDANINIIGGADSAYMEIINFNENLCSFSNNSSMVTFNQTPDLSSISGFWESGISFKGLRYYLFPGTGKGERVINIYLDSAQTVRCFDLCSVSGNITVSDIDTPTDYNIRVGSGSVTVKNVSTGSALSVESDDPAAVNVCFENVAAEIVRICAAKADFDAVGLSARYCDIAVSGGSADMDYTPFEGGAFSAEIATGGKMTVNGSTYTDLFRYGIRDASAETAAGDAAGDGDGTEEDINPPYLKINTGLAASELNVSLELLSAQSGEEVGADSES